MTFIPNALRRKIFGFSVQRRYQESESYYRLLVHDTYRGADKSLARTGRIQATATEDFEFHISYL